MHWHQPQKDTPFLQRNSIMWSVEDTFHMSLLDFCGNRHINIVYYSHTDSHSVTTSMRISTSYNIRTQYLENLASITGLAKIFFFSQDDKTLVLSAS